MIDDIGATIRSLILASADVTALISQRAYADIIPQGAAMPSLAYWIVDTVPTECTTGTVDISQCRIQIDCFDATRSGANALANAVRLAIEMYRGVHDDVHVRISMPSGEVYGIDRALLGTDQRRYITTLEFMVYYSVTIPA